MNKKLEDVFVKEFPIMFKDMYGDRGQTCLSFGIECCDGWFDLIHNLCKEIQAELEKEGQVENFKVLQVKEKFGTLRFYCSGRTDTIQGLIFMAEEQSAVTCERCGKTGTLRKGGWLATLCDEHANPKSNS